MSTLCFQNLQNFQPQIQYNHDVELLWSMMNNATNATTTTASNPNQLAFSTFSTASPNTIIAPPENETLMMRMTPVDFDYHHQRNHGLEKIPSSQQNLQNGTPRKTLNSRASSSTGMPSQAQLEASGWI